MNFLLFISNYMVSELEFRFGPKLGRNPRESQNPEQGRGSDFFKHTFKGSLGDNAHLGRIVGHRQPSPPSPVAEKQAREPQAPPQVYAMFPARHGGLSSDEPPPLGSLAANKLP